MPIRTIASGDPAAAAGSLANRLGGNWSVESLNTVTARLANGITSVDLAALIEVELAFTILIAAIGTALFLLAEVTERRRELATLEAIGAEPTQLQRALGAETTVIGVIGALTGILVGGLLGFALLQILAGVFDPPAQLPVIPFAQIGAVLLIVAGALVGGWIMRAVGFAGQGGMLYTIVVAIGGAVLLTFLYRLIFRKRERGESQYRKAA